MSYRLSECNERMERISTIVKQKPLASVKQNSLSFVKQSSNELREADANASVKDGNFEDSKYKCCMSSL